MDTLCAVVGFVSAIGMVVCIAALAMGAADR
jgi:hypothetical protein